MHSPQQPFTQMLGQQIRASGVSNERLLSVLNEIDRKLFVPEAYASLAYAEWQVPLAHGQCMLEPSVEARLLQACDIGPHENALVIGTGSGYMSACLAKLCDHVISIDMFDDFLKAADTKTQRLGLNNIAYTLTDAMSLDLDQTFDVVIITGAMPTLDQRFLQALNIGGRCVAIVGEHPVMHVVQAIRRGETQFDTHKLFETRAPMLLGATTESAFDF